jgi:hypothetical protein
MRNFRVNCVLLVLIIVGSVNMTSASVIDFDLLKPLANNASIPAGYGSTSEVNVSYATLNVDGTVNQNFIRFWNKEYADLNSAEFAAVNGTTLQITLSANDPLETVTLNSFYIAAYGLYIEGRYPSILRILDGTGTILWNHLPYMASSKTAEQLSPVVASNTLKLQVGYDYNIGVNKINFSLESTPVPEPSLSILLGIALGQLSWKRIRDRSQILHSIA